MATRMTALWAVAILTLVTSCAARQQRRAARAEREQAAETREAVEADTKEGAAAQDAQGRRAAWEPFALTEKTQDRAPNEAESERAKPPERAAPNASTVQNPPPGPDIEGDYGEHVSRSRALIDELRSNTWAEACLNAAGALDALSRALAKSGQTGRTAQPSARQVWHQANELRDACGGSFDAADRMKAGLQSALSGLEKSLSADESTRLEPWLSAARTAVDDLERSSSWVFQRARVQDAFRTVSDAFVALGQLEDAGALTPAAENPQKAAQGGQAHPR